MKVLVTGVAGFIGMHVAKRLLDDGYEVVGIDNLNDYYSPRLKAYRLEKLASYSKYTFENIDISDTVGVGSLFQRSCFQRVIHLAAQAGVRYSLEAPFTYANSNLLGMLAILEGCRNNEVEHLVYASSSSVYGANKKAPFSETDNVDHPISLYAATKKSNELMAHSYSHLFKLATTGLRFFTVYGPAGRPDMAPWLFTEAIMQGQPIKVFNHGAMQRDFTYIDDIVEGVVRVQDLVPSASEQLPPSAIFNIGNNVPIHLSQFIEAVEAACGKTAVKQYEDIQPGDVPITYADTDRLEKAVGFKPYTSIEEGIGNFVSWYNGEWQEYLNKK